MKSTVCTCLIVLAAAAATVQAQDVMVYQGMCDASAVAALGPDYFVVADDERNTLQIYHRGQPASVALMPLAEYLETRGGEESDLEGAAVIGTRIYWISSHGRNSKGKVKPARYRFFATDIDTRTSPPALKPVGIPYTGLLTDLVAAPSLKSLRLADAARRAPEDEGGLNIEGLAATPDGRLLIGFRNPLRHGRAIVVPLENPAQLLEGKRATFGTAVLLDLRQRGIRSLEQVGAGYLIVAGPVANAGVFALYRWSGTQSSPPSSVSGLPTVWTALRPEALFEIPGTDQVQILSDDGGVKAGGIACKDRPVDEQSFRSITLKR